MFSLRGTASSIRALRRALKRLFGRMPLIRQARIRRIRKSPLFNANFYADRNPDVVATGVDLAKHYALSGWKEHRNPSAEFSTRRYLAANPDVAAAGINPLLHYIDRGQAEGRQIYPVEEEAQMEAIRASGLFDADYYLATYPDIQPPPQDPIRHYCERGWREGRNPSAEFDTQGYLAVYRDIRDWGANPFWHYVVAGRAELRHANPARERKRIEAEVEAIRASGLFDADYYLAMYPDIQPSPQDPIRHYCERGWREGRNPSEEFDTQGYLDAYADIKDTGINPFWHYVVAGRAESRHANPERERKRRIEAEVEAIRASGLFDTDYYLATYPDIQPPPQDPIRHYCEFGWREGRNPSEEFDTQGYLEAYREIRDWGMNPFWHYVVDGRREGRFGFALKIQGSMEDEFDASRENVIVVSHEATRTGATILALNLVRVLSKRYNVLVIVLRDASLPLIDAFRDAGAIVIFLPIWGRDLYSDSGLTACDYSGFVSIIGSAFRDRKFKFALVNSIESINILPMLAECSIPSISLLHEFAAYYVLKWASLSSPSPFLFVRRYSEKLVFSTKITLQDALAYTPELDARDGFFHILPQGRCQLPKTVLDEKERLAEKNRLSTVFSFSVDGEKPFVVLGAGSVLVRKGIDLFVECAHRVIRSGQVQNIRFVWVGKSDASEYHALLVDQIRRSGLAQYVTLIDETTEMDDVYQMSDILLLTSRLDPLPNVAIDALCEGMPVVCFDDGNGIAEFLSKWGVSEHCVAKYFDTGMLANKILRLAGDAVLYRDVATTCKQRAVSAFDMERYVHELENLASGCASKWQEQNFQDKIDIINSNLLDATFWGQDGQCELLPDSLAALYMRTCRVKIGERKPMPGFHPGVYRDIHGVCDSCANPFADYIRSGLPEGPWKLPVIRNTDACQEVAGHPRIALHLHVFYEDLLDEIIERLLANNIRPDLFVSIPEGRSVEECRKNFTNYPGQVVAIETVPNRGRDIGPFLTAFGTRIAENYDFVGHLHTKKSVGVASDEVIERWRTFLLENLLGSQLNRMMDRILGFMSNTPTIGMVFPDDPNIVGWDKNKPCAEELAERLGITKLPENFSFPVGTMFWARVDALRRFWAMGLDWEDYPEEPIPIDGTILHALERLLPLGLTPELNQCAVTHVAGVTR